jgi:hypothetical protein
MMFLSSFPGLPNSGIRALVRLGGGAGGDPGIGSTIACGELTLGGECWVSSVE